MHVRWVFLPRRLPALYLCAAVLLCLPACKVARIGGQDSTDEVISSIRRERNELKKQIKSIASQEWESKTLRTKSKAVQILPNRSRSGLRFAKRPGSL